MHRRTLNALKTLTWLGCLAPLVWLLWGAFTDNLGPDPTHTITFTTGRTTLRLLMLTLAITPMRRLWPKLNWLIKFRRLLGLFVFFYATLHMLTWVALYNGFNPSAMAADIVKRRFVTAGMTAYLLLAPLAATSTNWAIRKMGGKRWARLHQLIYVAAGVAIVHYWWGVKHGVLTPIGVTVILAVLLLARPVLAWQNKRHARTVAV